MRQFIKHIFCFSLIWLSSPPPSAAQSYAPGIPEPPACLQPAPPPSSAHWPDRPAEGLYYVDNRSERATDDGNPFGSRGRPRLTIPQGELAAGSYVELHGGPYTANRIVTVGLGTADMPVRIRGANPDQPTVIRAVWYVTGRHVIIEHLAFDTTRKTLGIVDGTGICVRHNRLAGPGQSSGNSSVIFITGRSAGASRNNVIYGNVIRDFGDASSGRENDYHGVLVGGYTESTWILDNEMSGNGGDGVQVGNTTLDREERPRLVYIARNRMQGNRENAVDIKRAGDVIVSANVIQGYRPTSSSEGAGIVIHNDAEHVWVVDNEVSDSEIGVITTGSTDTWFVGNVIYDIRHSRSGWDPQSGYAGGAAMHFRGDSSGGAVGNTVAYYDVGLQLTQGNLEGYAVHNNIFAYRQAAAGDDIRIASGAFTEVLAISHNLIFSDTTRLRITWAGRSYVSPNGLPQGTELFPDTLTADPGFVDRESRDFRLSAASPAIGAGTRLGIDERFRSRYGIEIGLNDGRIQQGAEFAPVVGARPPL